MICSNSHASKIFVHIIYKKVKRKIDNELGEDQFGFTKNRGMREAEQQALRQIIKGRLRKKTHIHGLLRF